MMKLFKKGDLQEAEKQKLMETYPSLTEEDFDEANKDKLLIHLQEVLGKSKEELREEIKNL